VGDVSLTLTASTDLDDADEFIVVYLNFRVVGIAFVVGAGHCAEPPDVETMVIPAATYNRYLRDVLGGSDAFVQMYPTSRVDADECSPSHIRVSIAYLASRAEIDCNWNSIPDQCEQDCNVNGIPDDCDVSNGSSPDCNDNVVPDECEFATGSSLDCNENFVPDECDIAGGASADCQPNGVPDECEMEGLVSDCNRNDVPDDCDTLHGTSADCQSNGIPDECEVGFVFSSVSEVMSPLDTSQSHTFRVIAPPPAGGNVELEFYASADLSRTSEYVEVRINGTEVGRAFVFGAADCAVPPDTDTLVVPAAVYGAAVGEGDAVIEMIPSAGLDPGICADTSIAVTLRYPTLPIGLNCNDNAEPDDCETLGLDFDVNGTVGLHDYEFLGECLAGPGTAPLPDEAMCASACVQGFDADGDGDVDVYDAATFYRAFSP